MNIRRLVAPALAALMAGALVDPVPAAADPAVPAKGRMDAAARLAAGIDAPDPAAHGKVLPLDTDARGRALVYVTGTDAAAARQAVAAVGGAVSDADADQVRAAVPPGKLADLAARKGVVEVRRPLTPVPLDIESEGVAPSGAQAWHSAGRRGAGVKVGILDVGFGRLAAARDAGELPADVTVNNGQCNPEAQSSHGTEMAEVVHDMAPEAKLYLACVRDSMDFDDAARWAKDQGVQVVNVSMGFPGTGRGNGAASATTADWSPATVVAWLRSQGVVVVAAAGDEAQQHLSGPVADPDGNGWMDLPDGGENQGFTVETTGSPITIELRWDAWPRTTSDLDVYVMGQLGLPAQNPDHTPVAVSLRPQQETAGGLDPTETLTIQNTEAGSAYYIYVKVKNPAPAGTRFDLTIYGRVQGVAQTDPAGSIAEPASSPYAIAVGAITPVAAAAGGDVAAYSGRGPTIDGRTKPDVVGFTGVTTFTGGSVQGTSVAAAYVSGAAALYKSSNPDLGPAELEGLLLDSSTRAGRGEDFAVDNTFGYGVLNVGQIRTLTPPAGSAFTPLAAYRRVLDTRDPAGRHPTPLAGNETVALTVPGLPADATAVTVVVTAVEPAADVAMEVFSDTPTGIPSLSGEAGRITTALVTATLNPNNKTVKIKNLAAASSDVVVDLYGWYSTQSSASTFVPKTSPYRLLDTRTWDIPRAWGTSSPILIPGDVEVIKVRGVAGVPDTATAVLVEVKATAESSATANLEVYPQTSRGTVSLSAVPGDTAETLVLVPLADDGTIRIRNASGRAHAVVDLVGWYATGGAGARYVPFRHAQPLFNSATGDQSPLGPFGTADARGVQVTLRPRVPSNATAVSLEVALRGRRMSATSAALWCRECGWWGHTNLSKAGLAAQPTVIRTVSNSAVVPLAASGVLAVQNAEADGGSPVTGVQLAAGLTGYFVGGQADGSAPVPAPTGLWSFDEGSGTTAGDTSGNRHPATIQGGASWVGGHTSWATMLDGTSGYAATTTGVLATDRSFTVSTWAYLTRRGGYYTAVSQAGKTQPAFYLEYAKDKDGWRFIAPAGDVATPGYHSADAGGPATIGEWTHVVGVYDAQAHQLTLYVNGARAGQAAGTVFSSSGPFMIGAARSAGATTHHFSGAVDDVRVYDRALSESEVRELHQAPTPYLYDQWKFDEGSGTATKSAKGRKTSGTLSGGASWTTGVSGSAVQLTGGSAAVEMAGRAVASTDSFTVTAWAKPTTNANGACRVVLGQDGATASGYALQYCGSGVGSWRFGTVGGTDLAGGAAAHGPGVALNTWTHLAGVYDSGLRLVRLYVNGRLVAAADGVTMADARAVFAVGRGRVNSAPAGFFSGSVDDVRAYGGVISDDAIRELATAPS